MAFGVRLRPAKAGLRATGSAFAKATARVLVFGVFEILEISVAVSVNAFSGSYTMRAPCDGSVKIGEQVAPVSSW